MCEVKLQLAWRMSAPYPSSFSSFSLHALSSFRIFSSNSKNPSFSLLLLCHELVNNPSNHLFHGSTLFAQLVAATLLGCVEPDCLSEFSSVFCEPLLPCPELSMSAGLSSCVRRLFINLCQIIITNLRLVIIYRLVIINLCEIIIIKLSGIIDLYQIVIKQ